jgi:hypothetical protein
MRRHMRVSALKRGSARFALPQIVPGLPGQMEPCSAWTASSGLRARPRLSSSCLLVQRHEVCASQMALAPRYGVRT